MSDLDLSNLRVHRFFKAKDPRHWNKLAIFFSYRENDDVTSNFNEYKAGLELIQQESTLSKTIQKRAETLLNQLRFDFFESTFRNVLRKSKIEDSKDIFADTFINIVKASGKKAQLASKEKSRLIAPESDDEPYSDIDYLSTSVDPLPATSSKKTKKVSGSSSSPLLKRTLNQNHKSNSKARITKEQIRVADPWHDLIQAAIHLYLGKNVNIPMGCKSMETNNDKLYQLSTYHLQKAKATPIRSAKDRYRNIDFKDA
ncbi:hypothetical protein BGZ80_007456, partial [Entomortierella chlamydospora]